MGIGGYTVVTARGVIAPYIDPSQSEGSGCNLLLEGSTRCAGGLLSLYGRKAWTGSTPSPSALYSEIVLESRCK